MKSWRIRVRTALLAIGLWLLVRHPEAMADGTFSNDSVSAQPNTGGMGKTATRTVRRVRRKVRRAEKSLFRGVKKLLLSPFEIPEALAKNVKRRGAEGIVTGPLDGMSGFVRKAYSGAKDVGRAPRRLMQ